MIPKEKYRFRSFAKKFVFLAALVSVVSFSPVGANRADAWSSMAAAAYKRMLDTIYDRIIGTVLAALKKAAIQTVNDLVNKLVSGSSGSAPKFITDWEDYLLKQTTSIASTKLDDYLSKVSGGMSSSNFTSSEGFSFSNGSSGSYAKSLSDLAKSMTSEATTPQLTYTSDPSTMFDSGSLYDFNNFTNGPMNNVWSYTANVQDVWQKELADQTKIASDKAVAYGGYIGTGEKDGSGAIKTPGSNTKDAVSNAQDLGNKMLATATHPEEVIASILTQLLTKTIEQGISNVQKVVSSAITGGGSVSSDSLTSAVTSAASGAVSSTVNDLLKTATKSK